jgi:hypothetical protein
VFVKLVPVIKEETGHTQSIVVWCSPKLNYLFTENNLSIVFTIAVDACLVWF